MQIHIGRNGQQLGTFNEEEVREGLARGTFLGTDLAWQEGMSEWKPLSSFPAFNPQVSAQSPMPVHSSPPMMMPAEPPKSGLALASLICGIASIPGMFCCGGLPLSLAAIICGHLALSDIAKRPHLENSRGMAKAGLIMGYILIVLTIISSIFWFGFGAFKSVTEGMNK